MACVAAGAVAASATAVLVATAVAAIASGPPPAFAVVDEAAAAGTSIATAATGIAVATALAISVVAWTVVAPESVESVASVSSDDVFPAGVDSSVLPAADFVLAGLVEPASADVSAAG